MAPRARQLLILTVAQTAGQTGWWAAYVAALAGALGRPHPAVWLSAVTAAWCGPSIAARLAGGLIDRHGPRVTGAAAWAAAAVVAAVPAVTRHPGLGVVLAALAGLSAASACAVAAGAAAPTWMPAQPDLVRAGSWLVIATYLPIGAGAAGAANLFVHAGPRAAWALVVCLLATAAASTLLVPTTRPGFAPPAARRFRVRPAVRRVLAITAGIYLSTGTVTILEPLYVHAILARPLPVYGWLQCTWAAGAIATALATAHRPQLVTTAWAVPLSALLIAAGQGLYLGTTLVPAAFTGAAVFGAAATLFALSCRAVIVGATPAAEHGRALSLWFTIQDACLTLPAAAAGPAVAFFGLRAVLDGAATLAGVSGTVCVVRTAPPPGPARSWPTGAAAGPRACRQTVQTVIMSQYSLSANPHTLRREELTMHKPR
jgi:MFS family permease